MTFSWTRNGTSIDGQLTAGDTSTLTISSVQYDDAGIYVCIVRSGSVSVISNTATVIVYGMFYILMILFIACLWSVILS